MSETKPKKIKKSRVSRLTIARLYNLGNYEHIRYEITTEIPRGGSAKQTLMDTLRILALLKPRKKPYDLESKQALLKKDQSELTETEKEQWSRFAEEVSDYDRTRRERLEALADLDSVGGVSVRKDCKNDWEDAPF